MTGVAPTLLFALSSMLVVLSIGVPTERRLINRVRSVGPLEKPAGEVGKSGEVTQPAGIMRGSLLRDSRTTRRPRITFAAAIGVVVIAAIGVLPVVILLTTGLIVRRSMPTMRRRRQRRQAERDIPASIELLVLSIHAGLTPNQAIRELARSAPKATRPAFVEVVHRLDRGEPLVDALVALPELLGPRAAGLAEVTGSAERYGLPLSHVLDQLSTEARNTRRRLDEASARRLPIRLSFPLVMCTLPSFVLLAIAPAVIAALSSLGASAP